MFSQLQDNSTSFHLQSLTSEHEHANKTKSKSNQTVHNGFGQFPKKMRLKHDHCYNSGHVTPGITYSFTFSLSLLPMTVQTSLSLLKDNATSCNPALPSGHGQCNVLQSSPTSGFLSVFRFYSTSQTQIHDDSNQKCIQQHFMYQSLCTPAT